MPIRIKYANPHQFLAFDVPFRGNQIDFRPFFSKNRPFWCFSPMPIRITLMPIRIKNSKNDANPHHFLTK